MATFIQDFAKALTPAAAHVSLISAAPEALGWVIFEFYPLPETAEPILAHQCLWVSNSCLPSTESASPCLCISVQICLSLECSSSLGLSFPEPELVCPFPCPSLYISVSGTPGRLGLPPSVCGSSCFSPSRWARLFVSVSLFLIVFVSRVSGCQGPIIYPLVYLVAMVPKMTQAPEWAGRWETTLASDWP